MSSGTRQCIIVSLFVIAVFSSGFVSGFVFGSKNSAVTVDSKPSEKKNEMRAVQPGEDTSSFQRLSPVETQNRPNTCNYPGYCKQNGVAGQGNRIRLSAGSGKKP